MGVGEGGLTPTQTQSTSSSCSPNPFTFLSLTTISPHLVNLCLLLQLHSNRLVRYLISLTMWPPRKSNLPSWSLLYPWGRETGLVHGGRTWTFPYTTVDRDPVLEACLPHLTRTLRTLKQFVSPLNRGDHTLTRPIWLKFGIFQFHAKTVLWGLLVIFS